MRQGGENDDYYRHFVDWEATRNNTEIVLTPQMQAEIYREWIEYQRWVRYTRRQNPASFDTFVRVALYRRTEAAQRRQRVNEEERTGGTSEAGAQSD